MVSLTHWMRNEVRPVRFPTKNLEQAVMDWCTLALISPEEGTSLKIWGNICIVSTLW